MSGLRLVGDDSEPLPQDELRRRGNELLGKARDEGLDALQASVSFDLLKRPKRYKPYQIRLMREQAEDAAKAWQQVAATLAELNREYEKSKNASRP